MRDGSALAPLRLSGFRAFWSANLIANMGAMAQAVTAAWLMTGLTRGNPAWVASVQTAASLPLVLLSLPAGALADLFDRRRVMLAAQSLVLLSASVLLAATAADRITPMILLTLIFTSGAGFALANPAWHASLRQQVGDDRLLERAILLNAVGFNGARSLGPAMAGALILASGPLLALAVSAAAVVPLITLLARWKPALAALPERERLTSAIAAGVRYLYWSPVPAALTLRAGMFTVCGASIWALAPVFAYERLDGDAGQLGLLVAMFGAGAFGGAVIRAHFAHWQRAHFLSICTGLYAAAAAGIGLAGSLLPAMLAMAVAGAAWVAGLSGLNVAIQIHAARWVAARAISLLQVALFLGLAVGSFFWGLIADHFGLAPAMLGSAAAMLLTLLLGRWWPIVSDDAVDLSPAPAAQLDPLPATGPVTVLTIYRPRTGHEAPFRALIARLRATRCRDGARNWSLVRDASGSWHERFDLPDARAEQRRRARRTRADEQLEHAITALLEDEPE